MEEGFGKPPRMGGRRLEWFVRARTPLLAALAAVVAVGCGPPDETLPGDVAARGPAGREAGPRFEGMYDVRGLTTDEATGATRPLAGTVIVAGAGDGSAATFSLDTEIETAQGPVQAELIGSGEGRVRGGGLMGRAETRMFLAAIPGLDPKFPWIPGRLGPRVLSDFRMEPDGTAFLIEIATRAAPGEDYAGTRTTLRAVRSPVALEAAAR